MHINNLANNTCFKGINPLNMFYNSNANLPTLIIESGVTLGRAHEANKKGGKIEANERLVEQGTSAVVWIYGVQFLKNIGEKIGEKILKRNDFNFDVGFDYARNPLESLYKPALKFKAANILLSTAIATFFIGFVLPKINHFITNKTIKKEEKQKTTQKYITLEEFKNKPKDISFTSLFYNAANLIENNSTARLLITDTGVVGGRFHNARNKFEKIECLFRDIASIYFYLFSTKHVVKLLDKLTNNTDISPKALDEIVKMLQKNIGEEKTISNRDFLNSAISSINTEDLRKIEELFNNRKTVTLKEFKKAFRGFEDKADLMSKLQPLLGSKEILTKTQAQDILKNGWTSDAQFLHNLTNAATNGAYNKKERFVSAKQIDKIRESADDFVRQIYKVAQKKKCDIDVDLIKKVAKNNTIKSFLYYCTGTAISIYALGFLIPKVQYMIRRKLTNNDEFVGIKNYN